MATARKIISQMIAEEVALLGVRQKESILSRRGALLALVGMIAIVLLLLGLVWYILDRDVRSRKWAHAAVRRSADELRDLYDNAPCGYYSLDSEGNFLQINATLLAWLGYRRGEVVPKLKFRDLLTPESAQRYDAASTLLKEDGGIDELGLEMVRKGGAVMPILLAASALHDSDGRYVSSRGTVFDITERQRAEIVREQLAAIVDYADDAIVRFTPEGTIVSWNKGAERLYGSTADEVIGESISILVPGETGESAVILETLRQGSLVEHNETVRVTKDGRLIHVLLTISPIKDTGGRVTGAALVARDITPLKRAEQKFRGLLEAAPDAMVVANPKGDILLVNAQTEKLFGYSREELLGRDIKTLVPERSRNGDAGPRSGFFTDPQAQLRGQDLELYGLHSDGHEFPVEVTLSPLQIDEGVLVSSAIRDATRRKQDEQALREHARALQVQASLLDIASDAIMVRDRDGIISFWNAGAVRMYGFSKEEALGNVSHTLLHTEYPQPFSTIETAVLEKGHWEGEVDHTRRNGSHITVASRWVLQENDPGQPWKVLEINTDISQRLKVEKEIRELNQSLESRNSELLTLNKEMESFSYSVSHDLRAPLRAIDGFSQALVEDSRDKLDPVEKKHLERIRAAAGKMGRLIDDLLTLARTTRSSMVPQEVNLSELASDIAAQLRNTQPERSVTFVIQSGLLVVGDRGLLTVVLDNLLGNSWKFTSKEPQARIEFGMRPEGDQKVYFVKDNGAGFDMRYANKLFGAFQRLHDNSEFPGTGIGLANVQRVIHRHKGRIWAEGALGQGATFYFVLWENKNDSAG